MIRHSIQGARIKRLRAELGLKQSDLIDMLPKYGQHLSQSHLSSLERGVRSVSVEGLIALAFALDTTTDYLTGLTDDPAPRVDLDEQVLLAETNPVRREYLQRMLTSIERMPIPQRDEYWRTLEVIFNGIVAKNGRRA